METFGLAFKKARKEGLKKFLYKGNWYTTELATEKPALTVSSTRKGNIKDKFLGKNKYTIRTVNGNQYAIYDKEIGRFIGSAFNTLDEARNYANSNLFKEDTGELTVTAARTKITKNTPGFLPVKEAGLFNDNGEPRVYRNYETGLYFVVDKFGNIVGDSMDPNAGKPGFTGWVVNTGRLLDIKRSGQALLKAREDLNEVNQLSLLKKERLLDERERLLAGIRGMLGMANTVLSMMNMPNHAIVGLARTATSPTYTMNNYLRGFTIDGMYNGELTIGLGDLVEAENPFIRTGLNFINPLSIYSTSMKLPSTKIEMVKGKPLIMKVLKSSGPRSLFRRNNRPNEGMGTNLRGLTLYGGTHRSGLNNLVETIKVESVIPVAVKEAGYFDTTPINFGFRYDPKLTIVTSNGVPTANFYYDGEWNPTVMGRILTGDFVPGTTSPNWDGTVRGGNVKVINTKNHTSPSFGGITAGGGRDNQSNWYLYGSR